MKNLKFRGLCIYGEGMKFGIGGAVNESWTMAYVIDKDFKRVEVHAHTLAQFTGILDGQGREIYDGDIVQDEILRYVVEWNQQNTKFCINPQTTIKGDEAFVLVAVNYNQLGNGYFDRKDLTVIGNVHENPELLTA